MSKKNIIHKVVGNFTLYKPRISKKGNKVRLQVENFKDARPRVKFGVEYKRKDGKRKLLTVETQVKRDVKNEARFHQSFQTKDYFVFPSKLSKRGNIQHLFWNKHTKATTYSVIYKTKRGKYNEKCIVRQYKDI